MCSFGRPATRNLRYVDFCKSAAVGALISIALGAAAFLFAGQTGAVSAYLFPGIHIAGFLISVVPTSFVYWIEPEGGPYAFLLLALVCAAVVWAGLFGSIQYAWARRHRSS